MELKEINKKLINLKELPWEVSLKRHIDKGFFKKIIKNDYRSLIVLQLNYKKTYSDEILHKLLIFQSTCELM